ncbi:MAG: hypothetical protein IPI97_14410 [Nitrosomonas sp.]|nr:hypothetical protein [Nitrosomonas sp.]
MQHAPILNGFGQAFKASGYPIMGTQNTIEGDDLSIPSELNGSMRLQARYQKSNGANTDVISGDTTNSGQWQVPDEISLYFGGRIADTVGFFFEGSTTASTLVSGFKLPAAYYVDDLIFSVIPFMTDSLGASYGYEQSSTGAVRNIRWAEHRRETSAQQYIGTDTGATGIAFVIRHDYGYINFSRWAPAFMAQKGSAQTLSSSYLRIAVTPIISAANGDWSIQTGAQIWRGSNFAYDSLSPIPALVPVETNATAYDLEVFGKIASREIGLYATWAESPAGSAAQPNILNAGRADSGSGQIEATLYRVNARKAWTVGAEYSVIPHTLHIGAAYRSASTGGTTGVNAIIGVNPRDNAITLTSVYSMTQNIEFHLDHTIYRGTLYDTPQASGDKLTTLMLETAW